MARRRPVMSTLVATMALAVLAMALPAAGLRLAAPTATVSTGDATTATTADLTSDPTADLTSDPTVDGVPRSIASLNAERDAGGPGASTTSPVAAADGPLDPVTGPMAEARDAEPVVLTGAQLAGWASAPATGQPAPFPSGGNDDNPLADGIRSAHNGTLVIPPDAGTGTPVDEVVAHRWTQDGWEEVPVQVDERFPHFLANGRSDFGFYSNTDTELTYAWAPTATVDAEESWKKVAGQCVARYPTAEEVDGLVAAGTITPGAGETAADYTGPRPDPVAGLDADDEVAFYASDAGAQAPAGQAGPAGTAEGVRQEVALTDPTSGEASFLYLFRSSDGPRFDHTTGYVHHDRAGDADRWIDRHEFAADDPEKLGSSNRGYGPNLPGTVCDADGVLRTTGGDDDAGGSEDRFVSDAITVSTDAYRFTASGRWMVRDMQVAAPGQDATPPGTAHADRTIAYGADLIDRWKGRAFQQSPDSVISLVGFEDEQVNWEANAALLGWRAGPVRAIREVWGADSGTNVTKTETFYRDAVQTRYRVRVHPIPPDGLYTSYDYNAGVAQTYFNALNPDGVAIDGVNDDIGNVDEVGGEPAFFDAPDPTFDLPLAMYRWEQVAGRDDTGSLVYTFEMESPTTLANADVVPYYRDDACLDDGTGDDPVARPWPGEASTDERVERGYAEAAGLDHDAGERADCELHQTQGAFGSHGLHFFVAPESDNGFVGTPVPVNEIDGSQWQFAVPQDAPANVGEAYGTIIRAPRVATVVPQPSVPADDSDPGPTEPGPVRAGAASVDSTWHVGAAAGQYAGKSPGMVDYHQGLDPRDGGFVEDPASLGEVELDPHAHSTTAEASYGIQGREQVSALVVEGGDGERFAVVANDLYIPQDMVNRRVSQLLAAHDEQVAAGLVEGAPTGIDHTNLAVSVSHSHSSPYYSTIAPGPWVFEDVFDLRFFEHIAQRMAEAVIEAAADLRPVTVGAAASDFTLVKRHAFGPALGDDGTPAGYPETDVDPTLATVAFDDATTGAPVATWVVWGLHPEMLDGNDLLASEYVNTVKRNLDREMGGVTVFSQRDLGTSETGRDAKAHAPQLRQEFAHREYAQVERAARLISDAVMATRALVDDGTTEVPTTRDGTPLLVPTSRIAPTDRLEVSVADLHFAPPGARVSPTVSNCRTERAFGGDPGVPVAGLPDCAHALGPATSPVLDAAGIDPRVTYDALRDAGVPVPDNVGAPSLVALEETAGVHLQAFRLGDIAVTICPCEQWADQSRNIETRLNDVAGDLWYGFDWAANPAHPDWQPGVVYDGADGDGDGTFDPGHGPLTLPDEQGRHFCVPLDADGAPIAEYDGHRPGAVATWQCRNPGWHGNRGLPEPSVDPANLDPVSDEAFRRMKAQVYNDARGWDDPANAAAAESEPTDPDQVWGNVTHEELHEVMDGGGYGMVLPVSMSNDYFGYIASYREFQNRDHYRKALTGLGPHSMDFLATRLTRMAASLKGGPDVELTAKDRAAAVEDARMDATARAIGAAAEATLPAYEATLPADGGTPQVVTQPADVTTFDAAEITWVGGSTYTDTPHPTVERCVDTSGACDPHDPSAWELFATGEGEVQAVVDYPSVAELPLQQAGQFEWRWTATFEAFASEIDQPDARGVRRDRTPPGQYRFVVDGCHRGPVPGAAGPDGSGHACPSADPTGRVAAYSLTSEPFTVRPWDGLTVDDLQADGPTVSFAVGPAPAFPVAWSNTDHLGLRGPAIDLPDSYDSPIVFIDDEASVVAHGDTDGDGQAAGDADDERFCFHCTFRAWADTSAVVEATVAWTHANGSDGGTVTATFDPATGRFTATLPPTARTVTVPAGGLVGAFGEVNGTASAPVEVRPGPSGGRGSPASPSSG